MSTVEYLLLFAGGFIAGIINTLAGNGSAITLSLLIFTGMPATVANATNRIGVLVQTVTAVLSLKRTSRTRMMFGHSLWFFFPSVTGSIIGALLAIDIDPEVLRYAIGVIMLILLFTMINKPKRWLKATDTSVSHKTAFNWIMVFLTGIYAGFIQMGIGIILLSLLVLVADYSLRDANIIKLVLAMVFIIPAFIVFLFSGDIIWVPGLVLGAGQAIGAVAGARYIMFLPRASVYMRQLLIVILIISAVSMLRILPLIANLFS